MTLSEYVPRQPVLVIEDDPHESALIRRWLEVQGGYEIRTTGDGDTGVELISQQRWSLVISDLNLPHRSGLDVLKTLRESDDATPFLLVSGTASTADACAAVRNRASDFLLKPLSFETFTATTQTLVGTYTDTVRRRAVIESRLENRRHGQFLTVGRLLVNQLVSPITRLSLSADNLINGITKGLPPSRADLMGQRAAVDLAVRDATATLDELKSLLGMTAAGLPSVNLVSQAQAAMLLASPALASRGVESGLNATGTEVLALGTVEATRTALTSMLLSLAENAAELRLQGVELTVDKRNATPIVRLTLSQAEPIRSRELLDNLGAYYDMLLVSCGGFIETAIESDGAIVTICFQRPSTSPLGIH